MYLSRYVTSLKDIYFITSPHPIATSFYHQFPPSKDSFPRPKATHLFPAIKELEYGKYLAFKDFTQACLLPFPSERPIKLA